MCFDKGVWLGIWQRDDCKAVGVAAVVNVARAAAANGCVDDLVGANAEHVVCDSVRLVILLASFTNSIVNELPGVLPYRRQA